MEGDRPSRRRSIRTRVTVFAALVVGLVLAATSAVLVLVQQRQLTAGLDENLEQGADVIEALLSGPTAAALVLDGSGDGDLVAQVVAADGAVVAASPSLQVRGPLAFDPGEVERIRTVGQLTDEEDEFRLLSRRLEGGGVLHVASSLDDVHESSRALIGALGVIAPLVVVLLAGGIWLLVRQTLGPVDAIQERVRAITVDELNLRVPEPGGEDEISRLAATMNEMLDRIEGAVTTQRRFVADASHELRSPLTRIRTQLEVGEQVPRDLEVTHRAVYEEVVALQALVEDLLHLARADAGVNVVKRDLVDLDDAVLAEVASTHPPRGIDVVVGHLDGVAVRGESGQLRRVVRNLVDNAARHAGREVRVSLRLEEGDAVLTVTDDGPGIPAERAETVFERFRRMDDARTRGHGGAGLGLAIAREIVERHGGSAVVDPGHRTGARLVVRLPAVLPGR